MSATTFNADDMGLSKGGTMDPKSGGSGAPVVLPYMDNNEIMKRLDEHAKWLKEWEELLNRNGGPEVNSISHSDAQRHVFLKRKLHESLGIMARIVQNQIKLKKSSTDVQPSNVPPVMMPTQQGYQPPSQQPSGVMMSPMQGQPVSGVAYSGTYAYSNGYVPSVPMPNQGGDAQPTYYTYNPTTSGPAGTSAGPGQTMYVPAYQMTGVPTQPGTAGGVYSNVTYSTGYTPNMQYSQAPMSSQPQHAVNTGTANNGAKYTGAPSAPSGMHTVPQQGYPGYTPGGSSTMATYGVPQYAPTVGADGTTMSYTSHMLSQVPTSYYGNSSIPNTAAPSSAPHMSQPQHQHAQAHHGQLGMQSTQQPMQNTRPSVGNYAPHTSQQHQPPQQQQRQ